MAAVTPNSCFYLQAAEIPGRLQRHSANAAGCYALTYGAAAAVNGSLRTVWRTRRRHDKVFECYGRLYKNGLLTPDYGDLYEVATAYAGYRDDKNMVIGDIGIVFNFGEIVPVKDGENDENPNC